MNYRDKLEFYELLRGCNGVVKTISDNRRETESSQYRGVRQARYGRFEMRLQHNGKSICEKYGTEMEAALAYNAYVREFKGPNAVTNFKLA